MRNLWRNYEACLYGSASTFQSRWFLFNRRIMDEDIQRLAQEANDAVENWFANYDWDEAFEALLRKYE